MILRFMHCNRYLFCLESIHHITMYVNKKETHLIMYRAFTPQRNGLCKNYCLFMCSMHSIAKEELPTKLSLTVSMHFYLNFVRLLLEAGSFDTKNLYSFYQTSFVVDVAVQSKCSITQKLPDFHRNFSCGIKSMLDFIARCG